MALNTDSRVLTLSVARIADPLGNSFLIIVLPLYIASGETSLVGIAGTEIPLPGTALGGFVLREKTLIGVVLSLFGLLNSFGQPFTGRWSDRLGRRKVFVLGIGTFLMATTIPCSPRLGGQSGCDSASRPSSSASSSPR